MEDGKIPKSNQPQKRLATLQTLRDHLLSSTAGMRPTPARVWVADHAIPRGGAVCTEIDPNIFKQRLAFCGCWVMRSHLCFNRQEYLVLREHYFIYRGHILRHSSLPSRYLNPQLLPCLMYAKQLWVGADTVYVH